MKTAIAVVLIVSFVLIAAPIASAQRTERQTERSGTDVFIGYSNLQGEGLPGRNTNPPFNSEFFGNRTTLQGANASITGFATNTLGITADLSFDRKRESETLTNGVDFANTDVYYFMGGPTLSWRNSSKVEPFARLLAGGAHTRFEAGSQRDLPGGGTTQGSFEVGSTSFAAAAGGGLDVRVGESLKLRLIQVDWAPVFLRDRTVEVLGNNGVIQPRTLEGQRQDNVRFSVGVVF